MPVFSTQVRKVLVTPRFPARVTTDGGLAVAVEEGVYTFSLDYGSLATTPAAEAGGAWIAVWDETLDTYRRVTIDELVALVAARAK